MNYDLKIASSNIVFYMRRGGGWTKKIKKTIVNGSCQFSYKEKISTVVNKKYTDDKIKSKIRFHPPVEINFVVVV